MICPNCLTWKFLSLLLLNVLMSVVYWRLLLVSSAFNLYIDIIRYYAFNELFGQIPRRNAPTCTFFQSSSEQNSKKKEGLPLLIPPMWRGKRPVLGLKHHVIGLTTIDCLLVPIIVYFETAWHMKKVGVCCEVFAPLICGSLFCFCFNSDSCCV